MRAELMPAGRPDLDSYGRAEVEYRRSASPQANKTEAWLRVADFPFPGIMGNENQNKDSKNE